MLRRLRWRPMAKQPLTQRAISPGSLKTTAWRALRRAADLARLGLPDRVVLVPRADERVGGLVQQRVLDLGLVGGGREACGHGDPSLGEMAGPAAPLGGIEGEAPAAQAVPGQQLRGAGHNRLAPPVAGGALLGGEDVPRHAVALAAVQAHRGGLEVGGHHRAHGPAAAEREADPVVGQRAPVGEDPLRPSGHFSAVNRAHLGNVGVEGWARFFASDIASKFGCPRKRGYGIAPPHQGTSP